MEFVKTLFRASPAFGCLISSNLLSDVVPFLGLYLPERSSIGVPEGVPRGLLRHGYTLPAPDFFIDVFY